KEVERALAPDRHILGIEAFALVSRHLVLCSPQKGLMRTRQKITNNNTTQYLHCCAIESIFLVDLKINLHQIGLCGDPFEHERVITPRSWFSGLGFRKKAHLFLEY